MTHAIARLSTRSTAAWVACAFCTFAMSWPALSRADERSEIATTRVAAEARYAERVKACRTRFLVTSCVDDAKRDRREALDALRTRQLALDEQRRRERAEGRRKEIADKLEDDARRDRQRPRSAAPPSAASSPPAARKAAEGASASASTGRPTLRRVPTPPAQHHPRSHAKPAAARAEREAASRKAYADKLHDVESHREQALDATLRRLSAKPPASSLPVPTPAVGGRAASAASR